METKARYRDDNPVLSLSLGVTSVRHIVTQLEARYARVAGNALEKSLVKYEGNSEAYEYYDLPLALSRGQVLNILFSNVGVALERCIPSVTFANFGLLSLVTGLLAPKMLSYLVVYPFCRLVFGTLYPAYASYKAVRTKNLKEYVKWMMYWIVFALFTCTETFTDVFLSWFPFYYEVKIVLVLWLLSPATKGSSILYRKFVHPALCRREQEIDEYIAKAKDQGYHTVLNLGTKGVNYATTVIMQTAIKNLNLPNAVPASQDAIDGYPYENMEYQRGDDDNLPGMVEIVELNDNEIEELDDADYDPDKSAARSRGNVVRKRKPTKEKKARSRSRGRRTRSQAAVEKQNDEILVD
ncbi:unnamed protein product [Pieris macdunnoughi]|uniref:Receptor expression-enhancing protein n=1 Tax=Pieris macdunnoughi TaxID=345717 RepID=A0A821XUT7_9NEOP|nr:unnamed protein product [Pieris macdunnoughi]